MEFDLGGERTVAERSGTAKSKIRVVGGSFLKGKTKLSNSEWVEVLSEQMFELQTIPEGDGRVPTFRSLFAYFVRRQMSGAYTTPEKQATMRSEERRVGKECRSRWRPNHKKKRGAEGLFVGSDWGGRYSCHRLVHLGHTC